MVTNMSLVFSRLPAVLLLLVLPIPILAANTPEPQPNVVVIFCDDLGYGDLGCFGHPSIRTPNLDRLSREGQKWTQFYAAASVCTPSRAALMTGRLPIRSGIMSAKRRVLFPNSGGGIPASELTLAEILRDVGYATGCVGKWHLGHLPPFLPTNNGFDTYFGIPYSNDMDAQKGSPSYRKEALRDANYLAKPIYWNVPLLRDTQVVQRPANQLTITRRYTEEAVGFIQRHRDGPFFLYLAHSMPHIPLFASGQFEGRSRRGLYGDVIEEIDWSVGQVVDAIRQRGLEKNTIVFFTSDNGPWLTFGTHGGSAGLLRKGKGATWEGGMREPTIIWGPGRVKPGVVADLGCTMDIYVTAAKLAGAELPEDRVLDGYDLSPVLAGTGRSPRDGMFYYRESELYAIRQGPWKAHFVTRPAYEPGSRVDHDPPLLYQLEHDPSEQHNVADRHSDVVAKLKQLAAKHLESVQPVPDQLAIPLEE